MSTRRVSAVWSSARVRLGASGAGSPAGATECRSMTDGPMAAGVLRPRSVMECPFAVVIGAEVGHWPRSPPSLDITAPALSIASGLPDLHVGGYRRRLVVRVSGEAGSHGGLTHGLFHLVESAAGLAVGVGGGRADLRR